ncbi:hypothetical protein KAU33_09090 [Candidatus Dependentiae bacterium]|nr:hypothetical protein [Candidatus Dependentiae bacterium]
MKDFIKQHKSLFKFILILIVITIVSLFLTCLIWSLFTVEYKGPGSLEKENFSYFDVSNSTEYQEGTLIVYLRTLDNYNFKINNETLTIKEVCVIEDSETQKFYLKKYTYKNCNDDILIGDKECENYTIYKANVFIHKDVSEDIDAYYEKLRLLGKHVYMENYIVSIEGVK